jgi:porin
MQIRDYEAAVELTYQYKLADDWMIQPDLQYIIHPGGHAPPATSGTPVSAPIPDAFVVGLRTFVKF